MKKIRIFNVTININVENILCDIATLILSTIIIECLLMITKIFIGLFV